ncbi:MAG: PAS domain-containing protein [Blastocatellia bacterium]
MALSTTSSESFLLANGQSELAAFWQKNDPGQVWMALLDQAQDALIVRDLDDRIVFWNARAEQLYGWPKGEALGRNLYEVLITADSGPLRASSLALAQTGEWTGEITQKTRSGRKIFVQSRWRLLRDADGNPGGVVIANTDLTEKKRLESNFLRRQRIEIIGRLVAGLAHDLNNILSPVLLAIHMLRRKYVDEESQRWLTIMQGRAERGGRMIAQVLSLAGTGEAENPLIQLRHLMTGLREHILSVLLASVEIEITFDNDLWPVSGRPAELQQLLMSLCFEAGHALAAGQKLVIEAENITAAESVARMNPESRSGPYVMIVVAGTSTQDGTARSGAFASAAEYLAANPAQAEQPGLAAALTIVRNHRGFLEIAGEAGVITGFRVWLPVPEANQVNLTETVSPLSPGRGELILVVHDDAVIREIITATLEAAGFRVLVVADVTGAQAGLDKSDSQVRGVLLNLQAQYADELAFVRHLKQSRSQVGVLMICSQDQVQTLRQITGQDGVHLLSRPFTAGVLLAALAGLLASDAAAGSAQDEPAVTGQ